MSEEIRISHALRVLSKTARMRENEFICDFTVKVGEKSFPTHRTVLAASSDYFEALFSSNMKEAREGCVEMKGLGVKGVQRSIEFMYTGNAEITLDFVDDIFHAADFFQLDDLKILCYQYLSQSLSPDNCFVVANLAEKYNHLEIRNKSEVIISNLKFVMSSDLFPSVTKSDLLRYISKVEHQTAWQAAVAWGKDKDEFPQVVEDMNIEKFPFKYLWETVLEEPLVERSCSIKNKVIIRLFRDSEELEDNLTTENCVMLKTLAEKHGVPSETTKVITEFMEQNFEELVMQTSFNDVSKDHLLSFLGSSTTKCSSETVKWEAGLKWVKHDLKERKKTFSDIFGLIKLEKLSLKYLKEHVRSENLVKESRKCMEILMDVVFNKSFQSEASTNKTSPVTDEVAPETSNVEEDIVMVEDKQPPGQMFSKILSTALPGYENNIFYQTLEITYKFPEGCTNGIKYKSTEFKAYLPHPPWRHDILSIGLRKAFDAGKVFRLQHRLKEKTGQIIWGDIPHKTSMTGGRENNGYPDSGYLDRLLEVLREKGF